jgi:uncharacterized protein YhhL (DUF1145 family)
MIIVKASTLVIWLLSLGTFIASYPSPWDTLALWMLGILTVSHLLECIIFSGRIKAAGGNKAMHYLQVFLFGYFHVNTLPKT